MTDDRDKSLDALAQSLDQVEAVLAEVSTDQLDLPTPCDDWQVRDLIAHLIADPQNFVTMARGEEPDWSASPPLPDDWTSAFRSHADDLMAMWRETGDSVTSQQVDWQTAEFAVHAWDLVRALGRPADLAQDPAERGYAFMSGALTAENRGAAFAPPVEAGDDAPIYARLAAFAGRAPDWRAG